MIEDQQAGIGAVEGPPGARPDPRRSRSRRREQLLDAADDALRAEGPDVSMEAVAARAGVTKPILYRHFGDRGGLMAAVTRRHAERLVDELRLALTVTAEQRERILVTIDTYLAFLERDPDLHRAAARSGSQANGPRGALDEAQEVICAEVEANIREGLLDAGLDPAPAATWGPAVVGMARLVGSRWLDAPETPRLELAERLTELLWSGFHGIATRGD